jgi:branched-subunit amino acid transport protein
VSWSGLFVLAVCAYVTKAAGPVLLAGRRLPDRFARLLALLPVPMLSALVLVQTATDAGRFVLDARLPAVLVAAAAVALRAPFLVAVVLAAVTAALLRLVA